jgi:hypothetical protein
MPSADKALVRFFLNTVLEMAGPPYSSEFCAAMMKLIGWDEKLVQSLHSSDSRKPVGTFLNEVAAAGFNWDGRDEDARRAHERARSCKWV